MVNRPRVDVRRTAAARRGPQRLRGGLALAPHAPFASARGSTTPDGTRSAQGSGWHMVTLGEQGGLRVGLSIIRLTQDGGSLAAHAVLVR
jgi:hypothetical protein